MRRCAAVQDSYLRLKEQAEEFQQETQKAQVRSPVFLCISLLLVSLWTPSKAKRKYILTFLSPSQCHRTQQDLLKKVADEREQRDQQLFIKVRITYIKQSAWMRQNCLLLILHVVADYMCADLRWSGCSLRLCSTRVRRSAGSGRPRRSRQKSAWKTYAFLMCTHAFLLSFHMSSPSTTMICGTHRDSHWHPNLSINVQEGVVLTNC